MSEYSDSVTDVDKTFSRPDDTPLKPSVSRQLTRTATLPTQDASDILDLPYVTLDDNADMTEYLEETTSGVITTRVITRVITRKSTQMEDYKLVTFTIDDKENPKNWSKGRKWYCTMVVALTCFIVAFNSAVITADLTGVQDSFRVSEEVALLSVTVFVIGFGVGPLVFAPLSEMVGRRIVYVVTLGVAVIFVIPCAVAQNVGTLLVCRLIDGIAFSAPMTLVGGTLADLWRPEERGVPMAAFSAAPFLGPVMGPLIGGYLGEAMGWRWLYWIQLIFAGFSWLLITFTLPETYTPELLARRAKKLRASTGDASYVTEKDIAARPVVQQLKIVLLRPVQLLCREIIVFLLALYMSVLYGLLYMFFIAYPIVYQEGKGYSAGKTGLMFLPIAAGVLCSAACAPMVNKHYLSICAQYPDGKPPPEKRLIPMMVSCWFVPIGLFIFAWTSYPHLSAWGPMMGGFPVGFGFVLLYNAVNNYIVDSYQHLAASALAAKTFLRSIWGACTVLFTVQMYHRLGYQWASSLLAFLALACCAIPYGFYYYGERIRARSHYAYKGEDEELGREKGKAGHKVSEP